MLDFVECLCLHELGCKPVSLPEKIPWTEEPGRESGTTEHWAHTHGELHWLVLNDKPTLYSQDKFHFNVLKVKVKVAQSCPTLCDPMDDTVHGILQARILEPFPSPGYLPNRGIAPGSPTLQVDFLPLIYQGSPLMYYCIILFISFIALFNFLNIQNTVLVSLLAFLSTNYHIC